MRRVAILALLASALCSAPSRHATISSFATGASSTAPAARGIAPTWRSRATPSSASPLRSAEPAARTIDVSGLVVAPGFIDIHTHARRGIFEVPTADNYVRQGVTTLIEGPDGSSPLPLRAVLRQAGRDALHAELRELRRAGIDSQRGDRRSQPAGDARRAREDASARAAGDGGRRVRPELGPLLRARHLHADRRGRGAGACRRADGRHLHLAHARRSQGRRRQRSRDDRDRRTGRPADAGDPPQGHRQDVLGPLGRDAEA